MRAAYARLVRVTCGAANAGDWGAANVGCDLWCGKVQVTVVRQMRVTVARQMQGVVARQVRKLWRSYRP